MFFAILDPKLQVHLGSPRALRLDIQNAVLNAVLDCRSYDLRPLTVLLLVHACFIKNNCEIVDKRNLYPGLGKIDF